MKCAFILSPSYSGSTLLSILLAHHPELATLGEYLDNRERRYRKGQGDFCSCGERLPSCSFMKQLTENVRGGGVDFSVDFPDTAFWTDRPALDKVLRAYVRGPGFERLRGAAIAAVPPLRRAVDHVVRRNMAVISAILELESATVYLDSAKNNNRVLYLDRYAPDMEVKVIWLIRDGRGVSNSIIGHKGVDLDTAARRWVTTQKSVMRTVDYLAPEQVFRMKYEDLCADPHQWLADVCRFLELDPTHLPQSFSAEGLHITGNNMRLQGLDEIKRDTKWQASFSEPELDLFDRIGGELNHDLGYGPADEPARAIRA